MRITRLGADVDATHRLQPDAVVRTLDVLREYRVAMDAERTTRARLVATSAVRDAADGGGFWLLRLTWSGSRRRSCRETRKVTSRMRGDLRAARETEHGPHRTSVEAPPRSSRWPKTIPISSFSLDIGCVRLTERFLPMTHLAPKRRPRRWP